MRMDMPIATDHGKKITGLVRGNFIPNDHSPTQPLADRNHLAYAIDDPNSPLTAMFHGKEFEVHDETYTFEQESFSRRNAHVLTSIDYDKMSPADKAKEANPRTDGDYALSYIRREGKGRVFYEGHGHSDRVYAMTPMLEHLRAGIQYALGDLKADDSPSVK
jgi:type 1 glutamine amidotransferase